MAPEPANPQAAGNTVTTPAPAPASGEATLLRRTFIDPLADAAEAQRQQWLLRLLLAQDGSTTRICQAVAGAPLKLEVWHQQVTSAVPDAVRDALPGAHFIHRVTSLAAHGEVMMDNLVYVALDGLSESLRRGLDSGAIPIGPLLDSLWVRRKPLPTPVTQQLCSELWERVGLPDAAASRAYTIAAPSGNLFVIAETYRRGMHATARAAGSGDAGAPAVAARPRDGSRLPG